MVCCGLSTSQAPPVRWPDDLHCACVYCRYRYSYPVSTSVPPAAMTASTLTARARRLVRMGCTVCWSGRICSIHGPGGGVSRHSSARLMHGRCAQSLQGQHSDGSTCSHHHRYATWYLRALSRDAQQPAGRARHRIAAAGLAGGAGAAGACPAYLPDAGITVLAGAARGGVPAHAGAAG